MAGYIAQLMIYIVIAFSRTPERPPEGQPNVGNPHPHTCKDRAVVAPGASRDIGAADFCLLLALVATV